MRISRLLVFVCLCVVSAILEAAPRQKPPAPTPAPAPAEFQPLLDDIAALIPASMNPRPFLAKAEAAIAAANRGQGCTALNILGALRNQISAMKGKRGFTPEAAVRLDTDILSFSAFLLGGPDTAPCGGAAAPPTSGISP